MLGAGLGERLRPLTEQLPKPLIPVFHRPLITYAFDHLRGAGVNDFVVNTHHIPEAYALAFPDGRYGDARLRFRNESPVRLETAETSARSPFDFATASTAACALKCEM